MKVYIAAAEVNAKGSKEIGNEWFTLTNLSNVPFDLKNSKVIDGHKREFHLSNLEVDTLDGGRSIRVKGFRNLRLTNTGGLLVLLDSNENIIDRVKYNPEIGESKIPEGAIINFMGPIDVYRDKSEITSDEILSLWDAYDLSQEGKRDGKLNKQELRNFLDDYVYSDMGVYPLPEEYRDADVKLFYLEGYDKNGDDRINKQEFLALISDLAFELYITVNIQIANAEIATSNLY